MQRTSSGNHRINVFFLGAQTRQIGLETRSGPQEATGGGPGRISGEVPGQDASSEHGTHHSW